MTVRYDYDDEPWRHRLGIRVARQYASVSLHERVVGMLLDLGVELVLDVGCADGVLHAALSASGSQPTGPRLIGVDRSRTTLRTHPRPVVCADARRLPFADGVADAVTAINVLYHLDDPRPAIIQAHRVLRPGGHLLAATVARDDSPELAAYWPRPVTAFDAEDAPGLLKQAFDTVVVHAWDAPLVTLPDPAAVRDYLLARQAPPETAAAAASEVSTPLTITKRGALLHATRLDHGTAG